MDEELGGTIAKLRSWLEAQSQKLKKPAETSGVQSDGSGDHNSDNKRWRSVLIGALIAINAMTLLLIPAYFLFSESAGQAYNIEASESDQSHRAGSVEDYVIVGGSATSTPAHKQNIDGAPEYYNIESSLSYRLGIDVSYHQGAIDWQQVKANGIQFAFVRAGARGYTQGDIIGDEQFEANLEGAKSAGLYTGVYFFSQAVNEAEAVEEAQYVLDVLAGRSLDYPVAYDMESVSDPEGRINSLGRSQRSACARAFCNHIEAAGYAVMLYGNAKDLAYYDSILIAEYDVWFAAYDVSSPNTFIPINIWQFTSSGAVNGIETHVDLNIHFRDQDPRQMPASATTHES